MAGRMRKVYICGPLWAPTALRRAWHILRAMRAAARFVRAGNMVMCPHSNTGWVTVLWPGVERSHRWIDAYLDEVARLQPGDVLFVLRGWEHSDGSCREIAAAQAMPGVLLLTEAGAQGL